MAFTLLACANPQAPHSTEFSPYVYSWGFNNPSYPFTSLEDLRDKIQLKHVTFAFVIAASNSTQPCAIGTNGGPLEAKDFLNPDMRAFIAAGGQINVSFGGAAGMYLESDQACKTVQDLSKTLTEFVQNTGLQDLDFDIEQDQEMTAAINQKRALALAKLQAEQPKVSISFTLAVNARTKDVGPGGLPAKGLAVLKAALDAGVKVKHINLMTMNFGQARSAGKPMGELAIGALEDTHAQLQQLLPDSSDQTRWAMLGATPMIGKNDVQGEVFTLEDARKLNDFATAKNLGRTSFWAINRDQPCVRESLGLCSGVNTKPFEFTRAFARP